MIKKFHYKDIDWIDLESPTPEDIDELIRDYHINPLPAQELLGPTPRSRVDFYEEFNYLILHFPTCQVCLNSDRRGKENTQEIDFIVGKNFLITTHYEAIRPLHDFAKILEIDAVTDRSKTKLHAGFLFLRIMRELYTSLEAGLEVINDNLKKVEGNIFAGKHRQMVRDLAEINRDLLDYRWTLKSHREILQSFEAAGKELFGDKFSYHVGIIIGLYDKVWNMVENNRETFMDLRQINESLLTIKTNETVKTLTVLAFIALPFTVILQMFGMNVDIPLERSPFGFLIIILLSAVASLAAYLLAKYRKWL